MVTEITTVILKSTAPTVFKEVTTFIKNKYSEYSVLNKLSEDNHDLVSSISKFMYVKTLATGADVPINLFDFFQKPQLEFNKNLFYIEHINEIKNHTEMDHYNNIVFEGTVGQGKSILLRSLAIQDFINNSRIPIFIELKNISKNNSLISLIKDYLNVWIGNDEEVLRIVLKSGKVSLFLDAFDEIDLDLLDDTHTAIDALVKSYPKLNVIITSRPDTIILQNPNFYTISLCPYGKKEQEGLINKIVKDEENKKVLIDSISVSSFEVREVLKTPLMVILYVKQYEVGFSVPQHVSDFYKNIFDVVTFTHDKSKGIEKRKSFSNLNQNQLEKVFQRFCFELFLTGKTVFDRKVFIDLLDKSLKRNFITIEIDYLDLINDYTRFACLILKDGLNYTFIHKSIMEYYVANFISDLPEIRAEEVIDKKILNRNKENSIFRDNNIVDFISVLKPYFYNKYYFMKGITDYENNFNLKFLNDEENYLKFLDCIYFMEDFKIKKKNRSGTHLGFMFGSNDILYRLGIKKIRSIIDYSFENKILESKTLFLMSKSYLEISKFFENDSEKAIKVKDIIKDPIFFEKCRIMWDEFCLEIDRVKNELLEIESSVLTDDIDF